jgi:NLI interacting factor-like phosphatase
MATSIGGEQFVAIVDLDETLLHCHRISRNRGIIAVVRPHAIHFLREIHGLFDGRVVLFTRASREYADFCIAQYLAKAEIYIWKVLAAPDANKSKAYFGCYKHSAYLDWTLKAKHKYIAFDDQAVVNMNSSGYAKIFAVKPFWDRNPRGSQADTELLAVLAQTKLFLDDKG